LRILSLTAGAASMYCGSCLRDNTLAAALIAQGHDVILQPLYTPTRTDEANVSRKEVLFGGISVYLEQKSALFRHTPRALDRLWDNPAVIRAFSGRGIKTDPRTLAEITVSILRGAGGYQRKEIAKLLDWLARLPRPDIATLPFSLLIALAKPVREALGCPVVCAIQGDELFLENMQEPYRSECLDLIRRQVPEVDGFIAVSEANARFLCGYLGIPEAKMHVVPLGIQLEGHGMVERPPGATFRIGFFSRIAPEKGFHVLCEAYRRLRARPGLPPSVFEAAGYLGPDYRDYFEENRRRLAEWGLAGEFRYHGEPDREGKIRFLRRLDVASVPATYDEPKGIAVLEAMANGVPVVLPHRGSFPEMIEKTGGGILVAPDDPEALAEGLYTIWSDAALASRLSHRAAAGVRRHYGAEAMAARAIEVFERVRAGSPARVSV
jgi:glycosyltransferase involved in cell wall biosynthesis